MKFIRFFLALFTIGIIISSCQKDLAFETGNALGTLTKDASGDCAPILVNGAYKSNVVLDATNYADVQVNITELGAYTIKTDTVNGYSFTATGNTGITGLNTIRLIGTGKPLVVGFDVFTVKFGTSTCQFNVIVNTGTGGGGTGTAAFTLGNTAGNCSSTVTGTFTQGATSLGNFVDVAVTVQTAGTYTISTSTINGVSFAGTGSLTATSTSIRLYAIGSPQNPGPTFTYPIIISGTNNCSFNIAVLPSGGGGGGGLDSIVANIDNVYYSFLVGDTAQLDNTSFPGYNGIAIFGYKDATQIEGMGLVIGKAGSAITSGTYTLNQFPSVYIGATFSNAIDDYSAQSDFNIPSIPQTPGFSITVTSITTTRVIGTFSGRLYDNGGSGTGFKTVTNGKFSVTIYP